MTNHHPHLFSRLILLTAIPIVLGGLIFLTQALPHRLQAAPDSPQPTVPEPPQQEGSSRGVKESRTTADHSRFPILQQDFQTGPEVTTACLSCHTEAARQIQRTIHWTWECDCLETEKKLGKKHVINNFCIGLGSNEPRCTSCHVGYGWRDNSFDFTAEENVDCLVCHDTTGTYKKFPAGAGHPVYEPTEFSGKLWEPPDLTHIARNVGPTSRNTCGSCHFFGGGGAGVKHGSLDPSLVHPDHSVDVHMDESGPNFECATCHTTQAHDIHGSRLRMAISDESAFSLPLSSPHRASCISCHSPTPMQSAKLNDHTDKVACQTCHIPELARGALPTKMYWDWSQAGKFDENGKPFVETDENGYTVYDTKKGSFIWDKNVIPEYLWFNGIVRYVLLGDKIDETQVVQLNYMEGSYDDPNALIFPVKVHRGKQIYDPQNRTLLLPHLFGKDEAAYWKSYDWDKAIRAGMEYVNQPYSGEYGFIETEMYWPTTHMVAPIEQALACDSCHTRNDGRLASLTGFYLPGRDRFSLLDSLGWLAAGGALLGVVVHGSMRIVTTKRNRS